MSEYPTLTKAPIREALIDIQAELLNLPTPEKFKEHFESAVKGEFPIVEERKSLMGMLKQDEGSFSFSGQQGLEGFIFKKKDGSQLFQARKNGFTLNQLKPYKDFATFSGKARELWNFYERFLQPRKVTRLGLRYINQIRPDNSPERLADLNDVFQWHLTPQMDLFDRLTRYEVNFSASSPDNIYEGTIGQRIEQTPSGKKVLVLDLDVYKTLTEPVDAEDIWNHFEAMRDWKNKLFFTAIESKWIDKFK